MITLYLHEQKRGNRRPDGMKKASGRLQYLTDLNQEGQLYGAVKRAGMPHAVLKQVDIDEARALPGVHAVLTAADVPGWNGFGIADPNQPVFCTDHIRYEGDAVAAVAADSPETAQAALNLIRIDAEPLAPLDSPAEALKPGAVHLHPEGNVLHTTAFHHEDLDKAWEHCRWIVEETYETPRQMHGYMETEGGLFLPEEDGSLTVHAPTQHGYKDQMQLARILGWHEAQIRIVSSPIGGSFGGKDELNVQPYGALLALHTGRPVKIHQSRQESVRAGLKRHPMQIRMKTGLDQHGRIAAHEVDILSDTGAYATLGGPVLQFATEHAVGAYRMGAVRVNGRAVYTNNGVAGEFRGFGGNQVIFALEGQLDRLADKSGIPPWELRKRNLRRMYDPGPLEQEVAPNNGPRDVWEAVQRSLLWQKPKRSRSAEEPWLVRGIGVSLAMHGSGLGYGIPDPAGGELRLTKDGRIEAAFGHEEFGQGLLASLQEMMLDHFHCTKDDIRLTIGDTSLVPPSGSSTASRSTNMMWQALQRMVPGWKKQLFTAVQQASGVPASRMETGPGGIFRMEGGTQQELLLSYQEAAALADITEAVSFHFPVTPDPIIGGHYLYGSTAVITEVEIDQRTGAVQVLEAEHVVAAGGVVYPIGYLGQIEGGSVMALGFTLMEDTVMEGSVCRTPNLDTYLMPTIQDVPGYQPVQAVETLPPGDDYGPRGVGEIGSVALAPAIAEAVYQASGVRVERLPIDREVLVDETAWMTAAEGETIG
ncbi:xanthine dehydrogenase subunit D [Alkalicoccus chagannorensis]|uniref:xanthine dehydrogenase subunit D n=1 Tax=Alkalicoccus chagannorensis TaxID=427072 RepID=UPI00041DBDC1|nr:xanthine dehydrogenase subunit D [Alkalicoccus chagannorensis]